MKRLRSVSFSRSVTAAICIGGAVWLTVRMYNWIHSTWFSNNTDLTVPIMAALLAAMLMWTGFTALFRLKDDRREEIIEAREERELFESGDLYESQDPVMAELVRQADAQASRRAA